MKQNMNINWAAMFKIAVLDFKIAPSEFWKMTFPEFFILMSNDDENDYGDDYEKQENMQDLLQFVNERIRKK